RSHCQRPTNSICWATKRMPAYSPLPAAAATRRSIFLITATLLHSRSEQERCVAGGELDGIWRRSLIEELSKRPSIKIEQSSLSSAHEGAQADLSQCRCRSLSRRCQPHRSSEH